jgi:hypothetical protein
MNWEAEIFLAMLICIVAGAGDTHHEIVRNALHPFWAN